MTCFFDVFILATLSIYLPSYMDNDDSSSQLTSVTLLPGNKMFCHNFNHNLKTTSPSNHETVFFKFRKIKNLFLTE